MTCLPLAGVRVTTNCAAAPSVTAVAFAIDRTGRASSSLIVPVAVFASDFSVAFVGLLRVTVNASVGSLRVSSVVATETVFVVSAGANVSMVLEAAV